MTMPRREITVKLAVEPNKGPWDGDLTITGFSTSHTAQEVGEILAAALAKHVAAPVTAHVDRR